MMKFKGHTCYSYCSYSYYVFVLLTGCASASSSANNASDTRQSDKSHSQYRDSTKFRTITTS